MAAATRIEPDVPVRAAPRAFADLLDDLRALDADSTGALVYEAGARSKGMVLLESGRICWATVAGMGQRLRALMAEASNEPRANARVDEVFLECLRDKRPLGDALVADGVVTAAKLKAVFRQQTAEALLAMASAGARPVGWIPRHTHAYDAPFTFSASSLLVAASQLTLAYACSAARAERVAVLGDEIVGMSFLRGAEGQPTLLGVSGEMELSLAEVRALGRWAFDALARAAVLAPDPLFASAALDRSAAMITWHHGHFVHVAACTETSGMSWVLARLERDRCTRNLRDERQR